MLASFSSTMANVSVRVVVSCILLVVMMFGCVRSDIAKDKQECAGQLAGLSTCLSFVGGDTKSPTSTCCTNLKNVLDKSKKCLCVLVQDRNDPALGLKINATLALTLPSICHVPTNVSDCPALLHLFPNSTDAQVFEQFSQGHNSSAIIGEIDTSSGIRVGGRTWLGKGMVGEISLLCLTLVFIMIRV